MHVHTISHPVTLTFTERSGAEQNRNGITLFPLMMFTLTLHRQGNWHSRSYMTYADRQSSCVQHFDMRNHLSYKQNAFIAILKLQRSNSLHTLHIMRALKRCELQCVNHLKCRQCSSPFRCLLYCFVQDTFLG